MILKWLTGLVLAFGLAYEALSLDVEVLEYKGKDVIFVSGEYFKYDDEVFLDIAKANTHIKDVVLGDSDGGMTIASYPISRYIKANGINTIATGECVSSCGIVWLGGNDRSVADGGSVLLHLPYMPAQSMWDYLIVDEYCEEDEECRNWTDTEKLEIYLMQNLRAVGVFYDFLVEMEAKPEWISGTMKTNPWDFYQITE